MTNTPPARWNFSGHHAWYSSFFWMRGSPWEQFDVPDVVEVRVRGDDHLDLVRRKPDLLQLTVDDVIPLLTGLRPSQLREPSAACIHRRRSRRCYPCRRRLALGVIDHHMLTGMVTSRAFLGDIGMRSVMERDRKSRW